MDNIDNEDDLSANNYDLTDAEIKEMLQRKEDYLSGKVKAKAWSEIRKRYEDT